MPRLRRPKPTRHRYSELLRSFRSGQHPEWSTAAWASYRFRTILRLLAIEEMCRERGVGVLPDKVVEALEVLADFKDMHNKYYYTAPYKHLHVRGPINPSGPVPPGELAFRRLMSEVERFKRQ